MNCILVFMSILLANHPPSFHIEISCSALQNDLFMVNQGVPRISSIDMTTLITAQFHRIANAKYWNELCSFLILDESCWLLCSLWQTLQALLEIYVRIFSSDSDGREKTSYEFLWWLSWVVKIANTHHSGKDNKYINSGGRIIWPHIYKSVMWLYMLILCWPHNISLPVYAVRQSREWQILSHPHSFMLKHELVYLNSVYSSTDAL